LIKNFFQIRKFIKQSDVVHVLVEPYSLIAYWVYKKCPIFITFHGTYAVNALNKWYLRGLYKRVYKNVKKIICVSGFTQQTFLKRIQSDNTIVINNGINYEKFQTYQAEKKIKQNSKKIISVGALVFRKGYHIAISAVGRVVEKYPNLKYYIIGNQNNKKYFFQLKDLIKKYNLEDNVVFLQNISEQELLKLYYQADLFLLTPVNIDNNFEGFGLVYLEANACGKPVIGTYSCGAEDAIIDGFNGLLVPQNDIEKTSQAILGILDNSRLAEELSQNGLKQAQKMDWSNIVKQYIKVYDSKI